MLFARFIFRHINRHWGMNLAVLLCLSLGSGLLGSLPAFAASTAAKSLDMSLANSPPSVRNIQVTASSPILTSALHGFIMDELQDFILTRISINNHHLTAHDNSPYLGEGKDKPVIIDGIWVWSVDKLRQYTTLLDGDWPIATYPRNQVEALKPPTIQSAVTEEVANDLHLDVGDLIQDKNEYRYIITSIIEVNNPQDEIWWAEQFPFHVTIEPGLNEDTIVLPIFINSQSMKDHFPFANYVWRYIIDQDQITIDNIELFDAKIASLTNQLFAYKAKLSTGLDAIIQDHRQNISTSELVLSLLTLQAFMFILFTLVLMASLLVNKSESEIANISGRGASRFQIILAFAVQILLLACIAGLLIGPFLSWLGLSSWSWITGDVIPRNLPIETWRLSILAAGIGWLTILVAIIPSTKIDILDWQQKLTRPGASVGWQTHNIDIFLMIIALLLYWQLSNSGSFVMRRIQGTSFADPLLLIAPSLLIFALAMFSLRFIPIGMRGLARVTKVNKGTVLPVGVTRIARNPQRLNWVILLVSLTAAFTLFARIYADALDATHRQISVYRAGSNLRLDLDKIPYEDISKLIDQNTVSHVSRGQVQGRSGRAITILAVEPASFVNVAEYPDGISNLTMKIIMDALAADYQYPGSTDNNPYNEQRANNEPIPAIFSYSALPKDSNIGDQRNVTIAGERFTFIIQGIIADFPTLSSEFLIVNADTYAEIVGSSSDEQFFSHEAWIATTSKNHEELVTIASRSNAVIADSSRNYQMIRSNIITLGTVRAFGLNAFVLATISIAGLVLANYFSFQQRLREFNILNAIGFSSNQTNKLLFGEGLLILALGLGSGVLLGFGLARLMRPYLSLAVSRTLPGMVVHQISPDWVNVVGTIILLIVFYGLVTIVWLIALKKSDLQQTLRMGDE